MLLTSADISALDASLSCWEWVEYISEAFVILGCLGELVADFTEVRTPEWRHRLGRFSLIVLTAALAVELGALVRTNSLSGQEIALLNAIAADARTRAASAEGTAKGFDSRIAEAQRNMATAQRDAEIARENGEHLKLESEQLRRQNLVLQTQVLRLQEAASWRDFTNAQRDKFISLAKARWAAAPVFTLAIDSVVGNPEAQRYGRQLAAAISDALRLPTGLDNPPGLSTCLECTGVWVCVNDSAPPAASAEAKAIQGMLELSGVGGVKFCTDPKNGLGAPSTIKIIVGPKE